MIPVRAALALLPLLLGGCAVVDVFRTTAAPYTVVIPWSEAARRCYQHDRDGENPVYQAAITHRYRDLAFPGRSWLIGKAACDAFVDEMLAIQGGPTGAGPVAPVAPVSAPGSLAPLPPAPGVSPSPEGPGPAVERPAPGEFTAGPELRPIYFDFDQAAIRPDAAATLETTAAWLRGHPRVQVLIEGHCDERGTIEYNLALGERRARAARDFLVSRGVAAARMVLLSYGEERPVCAESGETCWQLNRRAEFRRRAE